ncbi:MAG: glycosyltransferase, partial [Clostridia bacterium]|nr:glycosyltransferase [Clostridia bacterium]
NALQPEETVIHVHTWTKGISSSIFKVADKKKFQTLITVHDYFLICPNGGLFDYPKRKICQKKPMSLGCIACNCDARNYFQKLFRVLRQKRQNRNIRKRKNLSYIFISEFSKREFFKRYNKIPESKQYFLKNTVQFEKERFRIACENNRTYLFIGGLTEVKGVRIFCEAVTKAQVKAIVVGQGILGEELKEKYPDIEFVGWKSKGEMTPYLKQTRSLIFPSLWYEAAPLTPLEVMAYGVPVICSDWNAGSEYIKHGENGWLYHGDSVEELIACLRDCSDEEIEKASKNAFENFDEIGLSKATYVKNLLEIYNKVLSVSIFNGEKQ